MKARCKCGNLAAAAQHWRSCFKCARLDGFDDIRRVEPRGIFLHGFGFVPFKYLGPRGLAALGLEIRQ